LHVRLLLEVGAADFNGICRCGWDLRRGAGVLVVGSTGDGERDCQYEDNDQVEQDGFEDKGGSS